jgi:N-acetyl-anhydromuramyl-L-alanine amidase AmpD
MKKTHIVVHHSLSPDGKAFDWGGIRKFHMSWRDPQGNVLTQEEGLRRQLQNEPVTAPWRDIGYHFGVELISDNHEILVGRWVDEDGAHCPELKMNQVGIGVCVVGNYDEQVPCSGAWNKAIGLVKRLIQAYDIPVENVLGHGEVQKLAGNSWQKTCPGKTFHMDKFRADLRASF